MLFDFCHYGWIVEDSARHLAVTTTKTQDQVEGRLLLNVVVTESASILELLSSENQSLLIRRDALLVLNLGLDVINGVRWLHIQCDGLSGQSLDKNLDLIWVGGG
jgi:hypothetical protein